MNLEARLDQNIKQAMIAKDQSRLDVLRFLKSAVKYAKLDKSGSVFTDADILQVVQKQIKQRRESIQQFEGGNRQDLADKEKKELSVLEEYMPEQLSDDDLRAVLEAVVRESQATSKKDFGRVMRLSAEKLAGSADNKRISEFLGKLLK